MSDSDNHQLSLYNQDRVHISVYPRDKIHDLIAKNPGIRYKEWTRLGNFGSYSLYITIIGFETLDKAPAS